MYGGNKDMKAWVAIGFPGARAAYTEWVDQHNVKYPLGPVSVSGKRA
jgi:gluconate 2-dehydrogenase gamma chain